MACAGSDCAVLLTDKPDVAVNAVAEDICAKLCESSVEGRIDRGTAVAEDIRRIDSLDEVALVGSVASVVRDLEEVHIKKTCAAILLKQTVLDRTLNVSGHHR